MYRLICSVVLLTTLLLAACGGELTQSTQNVAATSPPTMIKTEPATTAPTSNLTDTPSPKPTQTPIPKPTNTPTVDYLKQGITNLEAGKLEQAIRDFSKAIELKPDDADAYYNRGRAYGRSGNLKQAFADFNKAIELKPDFAEAYNKRGSVYIDFNDLKQAFADYNKAIELKPDFAEAYVNRALAYTHSGDLKQAFADFDKAIELQPDFAEIYYHRGSVFAASGELEQAIHDFEQYLKLAPDTPNRVEVQNTIEELKGKLNPSSNAPPTPPPNVTVYEAEGNLQALAPVGCVDLSGITNQNTPADIFPGVQDCMNKKDYLRAAKLYALAGLYGRVDQLRVTDQTAHQAITVLQSQHLGSFSEEEVNALQNSIMSIANNPDTLGDMCAEIRSLGPPAYYPTYMVQHGMDAFLGEDRPKPLKVDFNMDEAWKKALDDFLHCP